MINELITCIFAFSRKRALKDRSVILQYNYMFLSSSLYDLNVLFELSAVGSR